MNSPAELYRCPHCQQVLEADPAWVAHEVTCPSCSTLFKLGIEGERLTVTDSISTESPGKPGTNRPGPRSFRWAFIAVIVCLAGITGLYSARQSLAGKNWQTWIGHLWMTNLPTQSATPSPAPLPAREKEIPVANISPEKLLPSRVTSAVTNPVVAPSSPPPPDPLSWFATQTAKSPMEATLLVDIVFPIVRNGIVAGSAAVPAGKTVQVEALDLASGTATLVFTPYGSGHVTVALAFTDITRRAPDAMAKAAAQVQSQPVSSSRSSAFDIVQGQQKVAASPSGGEKDEKTTVPPQAIRQGNVAQVAGGASLGVPKDDQSQDSLAGANTAGNFAHPGLLHTQADFDRMKKKVEEKAEPWFSGWQRLTNNPHSQLSWTPHPQEIVYRGSNHVHAQNYGSLYNDAAAAYALALRWKISGDPAYAQKGIEILNAWGRTLMAIDGSSDKFLASGIYGFEMANAAEILRTSPDWQPADFEQFKKMMAAVFLPMNRDFLARHNGATIAHYWANWDLCNMASLISIGVLLDRRDLYNETIDYFKHGQGNGAIDHAIPFVYPDQNLAQWQESGRDQGHSLMGIALMGTICQIAWNQGDDLFAYEDNRFLKAAEYVAKYNLGNEVPYTPYNNESVSPPTLLATISAGGRGADRPVWELVYNHYVVRQGFRAPYIEQYAAKVRPEGGGGDYGPNSGGFDQLGYGTLTYTLRP